jgi:hypothetical protein
MQNSYRLFASACLSAAVALIFTPPAAGAKPGSVSSASTAPILSLSADKATAEVGEQVLLSWAAANVKSCVASGDWSGRFAAEGTFTTPALDGPKTYTLECKSGNSTVRDSVSVAVTVVETVTEVASPEQVVPNPPPPEPTPALALRATDYEVRTGGSTTLSWSGTSVSNCRASGAWSGPRSSSGTEEIGPLGADANFTLTCESSGGNLISMTSVLVTDGGTTLSWVPPTENTDGTPLSKLLGYRIYVGTASRNYTSRIELANTAATNHFIELSRGNYYLAMTALDAEGKESGFSNEVLKYVN